MKRKLLSMAIGLFAMIQSSFAVPAYPYPITVTQPDGSQITIQIVGDEFFNYKLTLDGLHVDQRSDGFYYYYTPDMDSPETRAAGSNFMRASDPADRSQAELKYISNFAGGVSQDYMNIGIEAAKIKRSIRDNASNNAAFAPTRAGRHLPERGVALLVQFSDVKFNSKHTRETFDRILNEKDYDYNGAIGSVSDYYSQNSNGVYNPTFEVADIVTLPHPMDYYGGNVGGSDRAPDQMIRDACEAADDLVDFRDFDTDGNGEIDNVFVYYAGYNEAEGGGADCVWPHRWCVYSNRVDGTTVFDGVRLAWYACTSELKGMNGNTVAGIGTFSHEFGHALGLPDFYDTDGAASGGNFVGLYHLSIMCSGSYNSNGNIPPTYTAVERNMLGWLDFKDLSLEGDATITNYPVSDDRGCEHAWIIPTEEPKEFFVIESRGNNKWDAPLGANGMLIYQWDQSGNYDALFNANSINNDPSHPRVRYIESYETTLGGQFPDAKKIFYPGQTNRTTFAGNDYGHESWGGMPLIVNISNIENENGTVTFRTSSNSEGVSSLYIDEIGQRTVTVTFLTNTPTWSYKLRKEGGEWSGYEKQTKSSVTISGLEPSTTYEIQAFSASSTEPVEDSFTTGAMSAPTPAISGIKGEYTAGDSFLPSVANINDDIISVSWMVAGSPISPDSRYVFNNAGGYDVICTIKYADGTIEKLTKKVTVK